MKERPILFKDNMVKAILLGRKSQTRRIIKDQENPHLVKCPYEIGDHLWVKETHKYINGDGNPNDFGVKYAADYKTIWWEDPEGLMSYPVNEKTRPSIFMAKRFSRITLEITNIRIQRLNDISEEDAIREGISYIDDIGYWDYMCGTTRKDPIKSFESLWNLINLDRGFGWKENPWVWVYEFKGIKK